MRRTFVPDGRPEDEAWRGASMLGIAAHPDDLEFMAWHGIFAAFGQRKFGGVIVTDGGGSARAGRYGALNDVELAAVRWEEQKKAAVVGGYAAVTTFGMQSAHIKTGVNDVVLKALDDVLDTARPEVVYTHNLLDAHATHVAVAMHVIAALRALPAVARPRAVYGCEVWRGLDWLSAKDRVTFDVSGHEALAHALMGVHDSQIASGKRFDLATLGRKRANATYAEAHALDRAETVELAMDLTPLIKDPTLDVHDFAMGAVHRFADDASARLKRWKS